VGVAVGWGVQKSKFKCDIQKNQCKVDPFGVGHFRLERKEGSETLKNRKCP